jgi:HAD superfamily hydrolase (TIGR01509 family)
MKQIKNIIFDLGGVIINIDTQRTEDAFTMMGAIDFRSYFGHGFATSFFVDYEIGKISDRQFIDELKKMTRTNASDQVIIDAWNALLLDFPADRIALLTALAKRYRLFLLSNTNSLHLTAFQKMYSDGFSGKLLDNHFEKAYYSHLIGQRKPNRESYERVIEENNLKPEETLFVDDAKINIEGANAVGLKGFFLEPGITITSLDWNSV